MSDEGHGPTDRALGCKIPDQRDTPSDGPGNAHADLREHAYLCRGPSGACRHPRLQVQRTLRAGISGDRSEPGSLLGVASQTSPACPDVQTSHEPHGDFVGNPIEICSQSRHRAGGTAVSSRGSRGAAGARSTCNPYPAVQACHAPPSQTVSEGPSPSTALRLLPGRCPARQQFAPVSRCPPATDTFSTFLPTTT